jgi:hypothetical protein
MAQPHELAFNLKLTRSSITLVFVGTRRMGGDPKRGVAIVWKPLFLGDWTPLETSLRARPLIHGCLEFSSLETLETASESPIGSIEKFLSHFRAEMPHRSGLNAAPVNEFCPRRYRTLLCRPASNLGASQRSTRPIEPSTNCALTWP